MARKLKPNEFTQQEAVVLYDFLDRVPITGHDERNNMTILCQKVIRTANPPPPPKKKEKKPEPEEDGNGQPD